MMKLAANNGVYTPMSKRLFDAIRDSRLVQVKLLVYKNQLNINTKNDSGENSLIEALRIDDDRKRRITFSFLLKCGIDVHNRDVSHRDSLEWAAKLNRERQALQLLNGPMIEYNFHHKDCDGFTILHYATINNMQKVVKTILKRLTRYYISVDISDNAGLTPYLHARRLNHDLIATALVEAGASPNIESRQKENVPNIHKQSEEALSKIIQLKINGRLPQLQRLSVNRTIDESCEDITTSSDILAMQRKSTNHQHGATNDINSLLQLKGEGETCDKYIMSTSVGDLDSTYTTTERTTNASYVSSSHSITDLNELFEIVSEQMTQSFCRPARQPKPKAIVYHKAKLPKRSTLAAIMKKPAPDRSGLQQSGRKKSHMRKTSKTDVSPKP